jgi:small-conductance mechanosensitive channel
MGFLLEAVSPRDWTWIGGAAALLLAFWFFWKLADWRVPGQESRKRVRKFFALLLAVIAALLAAGVFFPALGHFTIALGAVGAGIAFAIQEVIASVAGWLTILFAQFYKVGDRVELGGIKGDVIDIGILRTRLMEIGEWISSDMYNGRIVLVANSFIFKQPVFNYSGQFPYILDELGVPIRYGTAPEAAREMLERVVNEVTKDYTEQATAAWQTVEERYSVRAPRMTPMVTFVANSNWMQFTVRYLVGYRRRRATQNEIFTRMMEEIRKTGGKIALASTTSQIVQPSSIDVILRHVQEG